MNASLLNALSAAISDHPVHVLQLRKIVVALAISGRLNEGSASIDSEEILALLDDVKNRLVSQRILAKHNPFVAVTRDQLPEDFSDPSKFISLGQIARIEKGKTGIQQAKPGLYPLVVTAAERITADHHDFDGAAAIIPLVSSTGHGNASINRLHYQEGQFALGTILAAVLPHDPALFSARFLFEYLSAFKEELLVSRMSGTANVTLTLGRIEDVPIPLVPPAIQRQLDELMVLCDELEATRTERETKRDRLAAASLARLNAPDHEDFHDDARFALYALPALTARPDQIKPLRQTILNLAVRGKLVPQDPADEPAEELSARVAYEIAEYGKQNRVARTQVDPISDDDVPYSLPDNWRWSRLAELFNVITDGDHQPPPKADRGVAFLTIGNVTTGRLDFTGCRLVPEEYFDGLATYRTPAKGDILYTVVGATFGRPALVETDRAFCVQRHIAILKPAKILNLQFLVSLLASPLVYDQAARSTTGTAQPTIALRPLRNFLVPLPPLNEQHRIVAKVDELLALCDQLEISLSSADETRKKLLDALLAEALAPVNYEALQEAAE